MLTVAHIGNLWNNGYNTCRMLRKKGVDAHLFIPATELDSFQRWNNIEGKSLPPWVHEFGSRLPDSLRYLRKVLTLTSHLRVAYQLSQFDVVHSWTAALASIWPAQQVLRTMRVPYIAYATGSDLREETRKNTPIGERFRRYFQGAVLTACSPDEINIQQVDRLGLTRNIFLSAPIDTDEFRPLNLPRIAPEYDVVFFHPSRLDWGLTDQGPFRSSMKNTDWFFRAFSRFIQDGGKGIVIVLERGSDLGIAKALCRELGIEPWIRWLPEMNKGQLVEYFNRCDVVVDQFHLGTYGTTALEAMACGAPVMMFIDPRYHKMGYPVLPPIYNCRTEDEIYECIALATDRQQRDVIGREARNYVMKYHHWEIVIDDLIRKYQNVTNRASV